MATWQEFDEATGELITEELEGRLVNEALALGLTTGRLEAVCPRCDKVMPNHCPGRWSLCGDYGVYPNEVIYRVRGER